MAWELTQRQSQILEFILDRLEERGAPPTVREIAARFGFASPASAQRHLEALERKGYIRRRGWTARGIELTEKVRRLFWQREGIPLVGRVAAGRPILAEENVEGVLRLEELFPCDQGLFALRVKGDSMIGAGIHPGDLVIVRPQPTADVGQIVAAIIDDEGTIKRFNRERDRVVLEPANEAYEPIVTQGVRIVGVVIGLVRRLGQAPHGPLS